MREQGSQWFSHKMNNFEVNGLDWQCSLAGSSKRAPRIFIFAIVLGAEFLAYFKYIETHAHAFFKVIVFSIGTVKVKYVIPISKLYGIW